MDDPKNPDHIDELKKRLDSHGGGMVFHKRQGVLHETHQAVPGDWNIKNDNVRQATKLVERTLVDNSMFKKFFFASIFFFIVAVLIALYIFLGGGNTVSSKYIDISVVGSSYTAGGEELPLQILVSNKNPIDIELADLFIEYPKGTRGDAGGDIVRLLKPVGMIASGDTVTIPVTPVLYGEQGATQEIKMRLEYRVPNSNAIFTKEKKYGVTINTAPLSLSILAPTEATSNEEVTFTIKATSNAKRVTENTRLHVEYPPGFQFISATPEPLYGNTVWDIGDLAEGSEREIVIRGTILGTDGDERTFRVEGGSENTADKTKIGVIYNSLIHTILIKKPFIEAEIRVAGVSADSFTTSGTTPVQVEIKYSNNLPVRVTDVEISVKISGTAFDKSKVTPQGGYYDSSASTILWTKDTLNKLAILDPGDEGSLSFTMSPLPLMRSSGSFIREPQITVDVSIRGKQPSEGNTQQEVKSTEKKTIKVMTDFQMITKTIYSIGPFTNSGPIPPKAGQETTFTIVWSLKNTANPVSGALITATLPSWVDFVGATYPANETVTFDAPTRVVTWNASTVDRGVGFGPSVREASFQVKLKASSSQVGSSPTLVLPQSVVGIDTFTENNISFTKPDMTTKMTNDPTYSSSINGVVVQ